MKDREQEKREARQKLSGSGSDALLLNDEQASPEVKIAKLQDELELERTDKKAAQERIRELEQEKDEILGVLETINRSAAFELLKNYRSFKSRILPPGTLRRRWFDLFVRLVIQRPVSPASQRSSEELQKQSHAEPPVDFYSAELTIGTAPRVLSAGARATIDVTVANIGKQRWTARGKSPASHGNVRLSYHWHDEQGQIAQWEGERTELGSDLGPEENASLRMAVFAPFRPGNYTLEITLVHEGITWFQQKSATAIRARVVVEGDAQFSKAWPSCSIVIPVFNRAAFTQACLLAIERSISTEVPYEVIVVDNGSSDETSAILAAWSKTRTNARVISMGENCGFAKGCNQGARMARGEYIVLLNNDTVPTPEWLEKMLECAQSAPEAGVIGNKLLFPDGRVQHIGVAFDEFRNPRHIYRGLSAEIAPANSNREYQAVTGACMLIRKELYTGVGGMDERYKNSCEDVDFCMKVRERGYRVLFCAESVVYHFESLSQGRHENDLRNLALFKARWGRNIESDADRWCEQDGIRDDLTQFEPHQGYDPKQEERIAEVWKKVHSTPFPEIEKCADSSAPSSKGFSRLEVRTRGAQ